MIHFILHVLINHPNKTKPIIAYLIKTIGQMYPSVRIVNTSFLKETFNQGYSVIGWWTGYSSD